jgi:hypothetical protein
MIKKNKLEVLYEYDFQLIGIVCSLKEYKLAWMLNKSLHIKLIKEPDIVFEFLQEASFSISNFIFTTENGTLRLLKNKAYEYNNVKSPFLIPELKEYDYFLKLECLDNSFSVNGIIDALKEIKQIIYIKNLNISELKSKENLIF